MGVLKFQHWTISQLTFHSVCLLSAPNVTDTHTLAFSSECHTHTHTVFYFYMIYPCFMHPKHLSSFHPTPSGHLWGAPLPILTRCTHGKLPIPSIPRPPTTTATEAGALALGCQKPGAWRPCQIPGGQVLSIVAAKLRKYWGGQVGSAQVW